MSELIRGVTRHFPQTPPLDSRPMITSPACLTGRCVIQDLLTFSPSHGPMWTMTKLLKTTPNAAIPPIAHSHDRLYVGHASSSATDLLMTNGCRVIPNDPQSRTQRLDLTMSILHLAKHLLSPQPCRRLPRTMGNLPSMFCPTDSSSKNESLFLTIPSQAPML
jgi:hypothetical protein